MTTDQKPKTDDKKIQGAITRLENAARDLDKFIPSDDGIADAIGLVREVEKRLASRRLIWERSAVAEMPAIAAKDDAPIYDTPPPPKAPVAVGRKYKIVPTFTTTRSYNDSALLVAIAGDDLTLVESLKLARSYDAVRLTWRWTQLKRLLSEQRIGLRQAYVEVSDNDGPDGFMVGETKKQTGTEKILITDDG